jgi:hypothetical protein
MTVEDLWNEYREKVCPPELGEPPWFLYWQRQAFLCGVLATIGNIVENPACFDDLRESIANWLATRAEETFP